MAKGSPLRWKSTIATRPFWGEEFHEDQHEKHAGQKTTAVGIMLYIYIYTYYCVCFYVGCVCLCFLFDSYFVTLVDQTHGWEEHAAFHF